MVKIKYFEVYATLFNFNFFASVYAARLNFSLISRKKEWTNLSQILELSIICLTLSNCDFFRQKPKVCYQRILRGFVLKYVNSCKVFLQLINEIRTGADHQSLVLFFLLLL